MKSLKFIFSMLTFLFIVGTASAQNQTIEERAQAKVEGFNDDLKSVDESLALSEDQEKQTYELFVASMKEMKAARKGAKGKEAKEKAAKPIVKKMNSTFRKEILSKEQRKALNATKKKKK